MDYEVIICFETHVELSTATKLFCSCLNEYSEKPNSNICPICAGHPGTKPVLNKKAVEYCIMAGLALNCHINNYAYFERKNYFYPDIPKGYQVSQGSVPFCEFGSLEIIGDDGNPYNVGIRRIHLEEDAGKLIHSSDTTASYIDYNRSSVPLIEIVCDHERNPVRSVQEAKQYLKKLQSILRYIGVSECNIEEGHFRSDVNISVRKAGSTSFNNRCEVKNMASFKAIVEAIEFEEKRQIKLIENGRENNQETRLFDEDKGVTIPMRNKENAHDYRYFPDPDLVEIRLDDEYIESLRQRLPELGDSRCNRYIKEYGIAESDATIITKDRKLSEFFEKTLEFGTNPKLLSKWMVRDLLKVLKHSDVTIDSCHIFPKNVAKLISLVEDKIITANISKEMLQEMIRNEVDIDEFIKTRNLSSINDDEFIVSKILEVFAEQIVSVAKVKENPSDPALNFLIGQVIKKTAGKADAKKVKELLEKAVTGLLQ